MKNRLKLLDVTGGRATQYLDVKASEMWESLFADALGAEVKSLSDVSGFSTTCAGSTEESSETASTILGGQCEPLRGKDAATFGKDGCGQRQVSDGSTQVPESEAAPELGDDAVDEHSAISGWKATCESSSRSELPTFGRDGLTLAMAITGASIVGALAWWRSRR